MCHGGYMGRAPRGSLGIGGARVAAAREQWAGASGTEGGRQGYRGSTVGLVVGARRAGEWVNGGECTEALEW